jgi:hypothetical protein
MDSRVIIYTRPEDGGVSIITPTGTIEECLKDVPIGVAYEIVEGNTLPNDRAFRNHWFKDGKAVKTDLVKAKAQVHEQRRRKREEEFKPFDEVIMKQIPGKNKDEAETKRQEIRTKYDTIQDEIDLIDDEYLLTRKYKELL